ncbi:MAG: hypothetical protein ACLQA5_19725 [Solirubrobacteraceae bacterium]
MSSSGDIELVRADVRDCHDHVALLRAKLYRWGLGSNAELQELEQDLEHAEERLRDATSEHSTE